MEEIRKINLENQTLQSLRGAVLFLVMRDRFAWGNEIHHYRGEISLVGSRREAWAVAEDWRSAGSNFTILQVPGLIFGTEKHQIALTEFHTKDSFSDWDFRESSVLRKGTPIAEVLEAIGPDGSWRSGQNPSSHSFVSGIVDEARAPALLEANSSFTNLTSSFGSSREPIAWSHVKSEHAAKGALRVVAEFKVVNASDALPTDWSEGGLRAAGFSGFVTFDRLPNSAVPAGPGVYAVVRNPQPPTPTFMSRNATGMFKGKDPTVPTSRAEQLWVAGSDTIYIGKADGGSNGRRGLSRRLEEFRRHGAGEPVGHWGGRLIWQLADHDRLLVCWRECDGNAELVETALLRAFESDFQALPFANLRRGRP